ncbi:hypothetical protein DTO212C5_6221 [Paecilomyces variotii]|nr:hypothetical protein DTO212C5_6221 [Paecilomyces variotii]
MIPRHPTAVHQLFTVIIHWWWWLVVCRASIRLPPLKPTWGSAQVKLPTRCHSSLSSSLLAFLSFSLSSSLTPFVSSLSHHAAPSVACFQSASLLSTPSFDRRTFPLPRFP